MDLFSGVVVGAFAASAAIIVAFFVLAYFMQHYFLVGYEPYAEEFMDLEEVRALYRAYPMAEPGLNSDGRVAYTAIPDDWRGTIELAIYHKRHSFEVTGMRLTCWGDGGPHAWSVEEDILHHIDHKRCF